jgi:hypothetical protein
VNEHGKLVKIGLAIYAAYVVVLLSAGVSIALAAVHFIRKYW